MSTKSASKYRSSHSKVSATSHDAHTRHISRPIASKRSIHTTSHSSRSQLSRNRPSLHVGSNNSISVYNQANHVNKSHQRHIHIPNRNLSHPLSHTRSIYPSSSPQLVSTISFSLSSSSSSSSSVSSPYTSFHRLVSNCSPGPSCGHKHPPKIKMDCHSSNATMKTSPIPSSPCNRVCWSCPQALPQLDTTFCSECGVLQPPPDKDYFSLFGLERIYDIDLDALEQTMHKMLQQYHPDLFECKTSTEKHYSAEYASAINTSYEMLRDPLSRGRYILSLERPELLDDKYQAVDMPILMDIMELREIIEDSTNINELMDVYNNNQIKKKDIINNISKSFKVNDYVSAASHCQELAYYYSMDRDLLPKLPADFLNSSSGSSNSNGPITL